MATCSSFLPEKSYGQRILAGYSLWGCEEPDTTEQLSKGVIFFALPASQDCLRHTYDNS